MTSDFAKRATPGARTRGELPEPALSIRPAGPDDAAAIANLDYELAVYEKLEHEALPLDEWTLYQVHGGPLDRLAASDSDG
ncbi:MAG: hypothetical protein JO161_07905 [Planctomycetaceae bacterium]|nr:hypothetical protein [Planctomycetaceae bacterium]